MNRPLTRRTKRTTLSILIAAACLTVFGLTPAQTAHAQGTVATEPLEECGLGAAYCAAFSPDGKTIITAGTKYCTLWNAETRKMIRRFDSHLDLVCSGAPG